MEEKTLEDLRVPAFCPVCGGLMKGRSTGTYYDWGCCQDCYIYFLEHSAARMVAWRSGWRPPPEQVKAMREFMKD